MLNANTNETNAIKLNRIAASLAGITSILNMFAHHGDGEERGMGDALYLVSEQAARLNGELCEIAREIESEATDA